MATTITTFLTQVEIILGADDANTELTGFQINAMIKAAVERYSRDRPDDVTEDEAGDGGKYYPVSGLTSWAADYSRVISIEFPAEAVTEDSPAQYLEEEDWDDDYWIGSTQYIFLPNHAPAAADTMRIKYTAPYVWSGSGSSEQVDTPERDFYAICNLAAGLCCQVISIKYSRTSDSTITADAVNHTSRAGEFSRRAKELIGMYEKHLGLSSGGDAPYVKPAGTFIDMDTEPSWPTNRQYLFHGRHTR